MILSGRPHFPRPRAGFCPRSLACRRICAPLLEVRDTSSFNKKRKFRQLNYDPAGVSIRQPSSGMDDIKMDCYTARNGTARAIQQVCLRLLSIPSISMRQYTCGERGEWLQVRRAIDRLQRRNTHSSHLRGWRASQSDLYGPSFSIGRLPRIARDIFKFRRIFLNISLTPLMGRRCNAGVVLTDRGQNSVARMTLNKFAHMRVRAVDLTTEFYGIFKIFLIFNDGSRLSRAFHERERDHFSLSSMDTS